LVDVVVVLILFAMVAPLPGVVLLAKVVASKYGGCKFVWWLISLIACIILAPPTIEVGSRAGKVGVVLGFALLIIILSTWWMKGVAGWILLGVAVALEAIVAAAGLILLIEQTY